MKLVYKRIELPLKFTWAIARNSSVAKTNFIVGLTDGEHTGWGEVAPNIRYDETPEQVEALLAHLAGQKLDTQTLQEASLGLPACLAVGLDMAHRHLLAQNTGQTLAAALGLPALLPAYATTFTLPIMPAEEVEPFFEKHNLGRFGAIKVKVGKQSTEAVFAALARVYNGPVLVDGNEAFSDVATLERHFAAWQKHLLITVLEQPFRAGSELYSQIRGQFPCPILADESVTRSTSIEALAADFDGINIKLQKAGTLQEAIGQLQAARRLGMRVMIGCMVETSVGIWHGLHLAGLADYVDLDSMLYLQAEPFGWVSEAEGKLSPNPAPCLVLPV